MPTKNLQMRKILRNVLPLLASACFAVNAWAAPGVPAFLVHAPNGQQSVLIGSMHIGHPKLRQPSDKVLDSARTYVIEHNTEWFVAPMRLAPEVMEAMATGHMRRAAWAEKLTPDDVEVLHRRINCIMPQALDRDGFEALLRLQSPYLLSMLAYIPCGSMVLPSRDALMDAAAKKRHIPVVTLESQQEIAEIRDLVPADVLGATLVASARMNLDQVYDSLVDALNRGDFDALARIVDSSFVDQRDRNTFNALMLHRRNLAWMPALRTALDNGSAVVLVGAAHLPGPQGVITLLRASGYRVETTLLPAAPPPANR